MRRSTRDGNQQMSTWMLLNDTVYNPTMRGNTNVRHNAERSPGVHGQSQHHNRIGGRPITLSRSANGYTKQQSQEIPQRIVYTAKDSQCIKLTADKKDELRANNQCFICEQTGHLAKV